MTLREAIDSAAARLAAHEELRPDAMRDAELLLLHTLGAQRTLLFTDPGRELSPPEQAAYEAAIARRAAGEPIQYITGEQEFYGLRLRVTPAVLIPRPETEVLVEAALARLPHERAVQVADVGTGSGAIAIAVAAHLPLADVVAVDLSAQALAVARENAAAHGVSARMRFVQSDLLAGLAPDDVFDAVLSNPPYIPEGDRAALHRQVREYEPAAALFAGADGLEMYRRLIPQALKALRPGGLLAVEIGFGQREGVAALLRGWEAVEFADDLQGIARVAMARRPS